MVKTVNCFRFKIKSKKGKFYTILCDLSAVLCSIGIWIYLHLDVYFSLFDPFSNVILASSSQSMSSSIPSIMSWTYENPNDYPFDTPGTWCGSDPAFIDQIIAQELKKGEDAFEQALSKEVDGKGNVNAVTLNQIFSSLPGITLETLNAYDYNDGRLKMNIHTGRVADYATLPELTSCGNPNASPAKVDRKTIGMYSAAFTIIEAVNLAKQGIAKMQSQPPKNSNAPNNNDESKINSPEGSSVDPSTVYPFLASSAGAAVSTPGRHGGEFADPSLTLTIAELRAIFARIKENAKAHCDSAKFLDTEMHCMCFTSLAAGTHNYQRYINSEFERLSPDSDQCGACLACTFPPVCVIFHCVACCYCVYCCDAFNCNCHQCVTASNLCCYQRALHNSTYRIIYHAWDIAVREETVKAFTLLYGVKGTDTLQSAHRIYVERSMQNGHRSINIKAIMRAPEKDWAWDVVPLYASAHPFASHRSLTRKRVHGGGAEEGKLKPEGAALGTVSDVIASPPQEGQLSSQNPQDGQASQNPGPLSAYDYYSGVAPMNIEGAAPGGPTASGYP